MFPLDQNMSFRVTRSFKDGLSWFATGYGYGGSHDWLSETPATRLASRRVMFQASQTTVLRRFRR
ncbi:MAG: hypothetical protein ACI88C_003173 [Acidimicrobiales bacterium]